MDVLNYGCIKPVDIADGPGVRVSLFVSGCRNHCKGCFQPETWAFDYGEPFTDVAFKSIIDYMNHDYISGITILGGDPFEPENQATVLAICRAVREHFPDKTIWCYTGYLWEQLSELPTMQYIDVLVDGPFIEEKKNLSLRFCGSSNQRLIDVKKSLEVGHAEIWEDKHLKNDM